MLMLSRTGPLGKEGSNITISRRNGGRSCWSCGRQLWLRRWPYSSAGPSSRILGRWVVMRGMAACRCSCSGTPQVLCCRANAATCLTGAAGMAVLTHSPPHACQPALPESRSPCCFHVLADSRAGQHTQLHGTFCTDLSMPSALSKVMRPPRKTQLSWCQHANCRG